MNYYFDERESRKIMGSFSKPITNLQQFITKYVPRASLVSCLDEDYLFISQQAWIACNGGFILVLEKFSHRMLYFTNFRENHFI